MPMDGRSDRDTKRQDMRGLPDDWRERLIERMPNYGPATLTAAVTGCRPAELASGVQLNMYESEELDIHPEFQRFDNDLQVDN